MPRRSNGEGCITQRPALHGESSTGRWQGSLQVEGKRRTVYGKTEREVRSKLLALQKQVAANGVLAQPGRRTVNDLLDLWLSIVRPTLKPRTVAEYEGVCERYLRPTLGKIALAKLRPDQLQGVYAGLQAKGLKRAPTYAHVTLHRALKLAVLWGWLPSNPADRVLKPGYRAARKEVWTTQELRTFLEGTGGHRLRPLWLLALATGCRLGELLALKWQDVDLEAGTIAVKGTMARIKGQWVEGTPKTKSGERTLSLPAEAVAALERQRLQQTAWRLWAGPSWQDSGLVFSSQTGEPLGHAAVEHALQRECHRLGLPPLTPHGLRHLHASLLLAEGVPITAVSARLGHANSAITGSIYAHAIKGQDRQAADAIGRALSG